MDGERSIGKRECSAFRNATNNEIKDIKANVRNNAEDIKIIMQQTATHDATMRSFKDVVDNLNATVIKLAEVLSRVDKETALNSNDIKWNWKTILAAGSVISFLVAIVLSFITKYM